MTHVDFVIWMLGWPFLWMIARKDHVPNFVVCVFLFMWFGIGGLLWFK